jgi:hypothetical protein
MARRLRKAPWHDSVGNCTRLDRTRARSGLVAVGVESTGSGSKDAQAPKRASEPINSALLSTAKPVKPANRAPASGYLLRCAPDRQISDLPVQPPFQKYSRSLLTQITCISVTVPSHRGRLAIVTDAGRDAMDVGCATDERAACGRQSRVVLTPRRWRQVGGRHSAGDGGKQARSPGRARNKLLKPLRGECRAVPV